MRDYQLYIDGKWTRGRDRKTFPSINPFNQEPWATITEASESDVRAAVEAARRAFRDTWRDTPGIARADLMQRLASAIEESADDMALLESTDNGKIIRETRGQMMFAGRLFRFYSGFADKLCGTVIPIDHKDVFDYAILEPLGVAALITPWNSPIVLLASKLAPALAAGNCVVVKPSEHASVTTLEFCRLVEKAGFPPGVFNVVTGGAETGRALVTAGGVNKVSFTGGAAAGREIAAAAGRNLIPVLLELGGKSPNIIFDDADLDKAIVGALAGIFGATGQTCIAGSRLLVHRPVYDEVVDRLAQRARAIRLGDPTDPATEMGTAANEPQFRRILASIDAAKKEGARLVAGGEPARDGNLAKGFFIKPTIFADVDNRSALAQEEIFGPVLAIIPFETEEQAVAIANDTRYGLASGIWSRDVGRILRVSRALEAGTVWVNTYRVASAQAPFGGVKESGFGRERGEAALLEFLTYKNVMIDYSGAERDPFADKS
jgi:acyl-CoA reductase-like NAD-dependent aldehyde dehydrogenase